MKFYPRFPHLLTDLDEILWSSCKFREDRSDKTILYVRALTKFCSAFYIFIPVWTNSVLEIATTIYRVTLSFVKISAVQTTLYLKL
jgi:hypothetical protein